MIVVVVVAAENSYCHCHCCADLNTERDDELMLSMSFKRGENYNRQM
jgi:hypothetical protein